MNPVTSYLRQLEEDLKRHSPTEHTHRSTLKTFLEEKIPDITVINEQERIECGAPDLVVLSEEDLPIGYIETKDVGVNLERIAREDQLKRYREALPNLILSDYLEFRWYVDGELRESASMGEWDGRTLRTNPDGIQAVIALLNRFMEQVPRWISIIRKSLPAGWHIWHI